MSIFKRMEQTFLLEEIGPTTIKLDSSQLVREIRNHPIIYDNNMRRDQCSMSMAWDSICSRMLPNFSTMTNNERIATRKRLKDRWSYMRSTFRRDVMNNKVDCHKHLDWVREIDFLLPILTRPPTNIIITTQNNNNDPQTSSQNSEAIILECSETFAVSSIEASTSESIISCDSSSSDDKSVNSDISLITTTAEEKDEDDLMVETFMSTFSPESVSTSVDDPDQLFLLAILQNYRFVQNENKEALQHKFYTFLRD